MSESNSPQTEEKICVFYDGSCPSCIKDRASYERLAGDSGKEVDWVDITGREKELKDIGIDPRKAMLELHVKDQNDKVYSEIDAYVLLMSRVWLLKPVAWFINLPLLKPLLGKFYRRWVMNRLKKEGRL